MSSKTQFIMSITRSYNISRTFSTNSKLIKYHSISPQAGLGHRFLSYNTRLIHDQNMSSRKFSSQSSSTQPATPSHSQPPSSLFWIFGITITTALPFVVQLKNDVDTAVETIEQIVEVVENVADVVDKVADGISSDLPEGAKIKKVIVLVGNVAEGTAKDAHSIGDAIDEFQDVEGKVENIIQTLTGVTNKPATTKS